jgi:hypothetical protein
MENKILLVILAIALVFGMTACPGGGSNTPTDNNLSGTYYRYDKGPGQYHSVTFINNSKFIMSDTTHSLHLHAQGTYTISGNTITCKITKLDYGTLDFEGKSFIFTILNPTQIRYVYDSTEYILDKQ